MNILLMGEVMMRLSPPGLTRLIQANNFEVFPGGSEFNTAICISQLGGNANLLTRLPKGPLGDIVTMKAQSYGVNTNNVIRSTDDNSRMGIYYYERGARPRPSQVIYDRENSAMSKMSINDLSAEMFNDIDCFHVTGITPALSETCHEAVLKSIVLAKSARAKISFDINYRSKLWSLEEARPIIKEIVGKSDILISGINDIVDLLEIKSPREDVKTIAQECLDQYDLDFIAIHGLPGIRALALSNNGCWESQVQSSGGTYRLGSGDSFDAGFLHEIFKNYDNPDVAEALEMGIVLSNWKRSVLGDFAIASYDEIKAAVQANREKRNVDVKR